MRSGPAFMLALVGGLYRPVEGKGKIAVSIWAVGGKKRLSKVSGKVSEVVELELEQEQ